MKPNQISVQKVIFEPKIISQKPTVVYLPGFSLSAKSKAVNYLCNFLASKGYLTLAISTTPHILLENSLVEEAKEVVDILQKTIQNPFILVAHSKGASKAIAVLEQLKQKPEAVVLITPVGLYSQTNKQLQKLFAKEIKENTFPEIKKEFSKGHKPMLNLALSVVSMATNEAKVFLKKYPQRLSLETKELAITAPERAKRILASLYIPILIAYTNSDRVVETEKLQETINQIKKQYKKENIITEEIHEPTTHGLPYTHPEIVEKLITEIISN